MCIRDSKDTVNSCMIGADGAVLSASADCTLRLYEIRDSSSSTFTIQEDEGDSELSYDCVRTFRGHSLAVKCCFLSEDGFQALSASADETVKVWSTSSSKCVMTMRSHVGAVNCCAFSPRDTHIVSGGEDLLVRVWEGYMDLAGEGDSPSKSVVTQPIQVLTGHQTPVMAARFSPDGLGLATCASSGNVRLWLWGQQVCLYLSLIHISEPTRPY
eukprot:TRINITY_DN52192_c0_g1_i1.p1 TRINITY_DN52192_c0_g1~~TRINITY_DN52192_c0_g1_i1.p1  ORF type:complete len:214 (-),score=41.35 TRINITY_DN52192_c0_g1_i1:7-648(-)